MTRKLKRIFSPDNEKDRDRFNEIAMEIEKEDKNVTITSIYSLLGDAMRENAKVYKFNKPIKSDKKIPIFVFL